VDDPDTPMTRRPADEEPFSALAFKIMADKYVGTLTFCRVYRCAGKPLTWCHRVCFSENYYYYFVNSFMV
jgi:hypothetical protein